MVFLDALALTVYDEANSQNEGRWFTLGFDASGTLLAVAHTYEMTGTVQCSDAHRLCPQGHKT